jgi:hypothetical protein
MICKIARSKAARLAAYIHIRIFYLSISRQVKKEKPAEKLQVQ